MPIVNTTMPITARSCDEMILAIVEAYPFCRTEVLTQTAFGRPLRTLVIGNGPRKVIYSAAHHANEWITSLLILKFAEEFAEAIASSGQIGGMDAGELAKTATVYMVPMVDPDGVDLVVGATLPGTVEYEIARRLSDNYPDIPFPDGWKANLLGIDLNLQYPAGWLQAREIKFSQGFTKPGPRDYVGRAPLNQLESRAMAGYTEFIDPAIVIAFHTQGKLIFWTFRDIEVPGSGGARGPSWQRIWAAGPSVRAERGEREAHIGGLLPPGAGSWGAGQVETGPDYLGISTATAREW